jgi:hypothetical protein
MLSMLHRRPVSIGLPPRVRPRWLVLAVALASAPDASAISGVCPDGSIFVVRNAADIPCSNARRVESSQMPPLRPENLPRPYLWQVYQEKQNENNPYNLLERADRVRAGHAGQAEAPSGTPSPPAPGPHAGATPQVASAPPTHAPAPPHADKLDLGLTDGELRDLFYLVELSQQQVPATFVEDAGGHEAMRVSFAHSAAFEERVRHAGSVDGTVVLWSVQPKEKQHFQPNFTFVQGQTAFHPQPGRSHELDVLVGRIGGELGPQDLVLGYAVLPPSIDAKRPIDLYWDDRRIAVTFR